MSHRRKERGQGTGRMSARAVYKSPVTFTETLLGMIDDRDLREVLGTEPTVAVVTFDQLRKLIMGNQDNEEARRYLGTIPQGVDPQYALTGMPAVCCGRNTALINADACFKLYSPYARDVLTETARHIVEFLLSMWVELVVFHELLHLPPHSMTHGKPMEKKVIEYVRERMLPRSMRFPSEGGWIVRDFLGLMIAAETNGPASLGERQSLDKKKYNNTLEPALLRAVSYSGN